MTTSALGSSGLDMGIGSRSEGPVAKSIERQTSKLPSDLFLWSAVAAMAGSLAFQVLGDSRKSLFVGQWAPAILIMGVYNKLVKLHGSD